MIRIALVYGAFAGAVIIASMILGFVLSDGKGAGSSQFLGYTIMIVALSLIFFGVKRYRDHDLGGVIKFGPAFLLGLAISAVAGVIYVVGWESYLAITGYNFIGEYTAGIIAKKQAAGITGAALETVIANMEKLKTQYANPAYRMPITFMEIFPVGLLVSLVSAALLRNSNFLPARG